MKKQALTAILASATLATAHADTVSVGGTRHTLTNNDFVQNGHTYVADIRVIGDHGQQIIFDVDAIVEGKGYQKREEICFSYHPDDPPCSESYFKYYPEFYYEVDMVVSCSGIALGDSSQNRNQTLSDGYRMPYSLTGRTVNLLLDRQISTGGNCENLKITIDGTKVHSLENISVDVFVVEPF